MKKLFGLTAGILLILLFSAQGQSDFVPLKELFKNDFLMSTTLDARPAPTGFRACFFIFTPL